MTSNWLHEYLVDSIRKNLCTKINCTTCGAMEFRQGLLCALSIESGREIKVYESRETINDIAKGLALIVPSAIESSDLVPAVRFLLFDLWNKRYFLDEDIESLLTKSWAGSIFNAMKEHHAARETERRARAEMQDPINVKNRRDQKREIKQKQHEQRLAMKKERDRIWRETHGKAD